MGSAGHRGTGDGGREGAPLAVCGRPPPPAAHPLPGRAAGPAPPRHDHARRLAGRRARHARRPRAGLPAAGARRGAAPPGRPGGGARRETVGGGWGGARCGRGPTRRDPPSLPPSTGISHARPQAGHVHLPRRAGGAVAGGGGDAAGVLFGEGKREREGNGVGSPAHAHAPARDTNLSQPSQSVKYNIPVALWLGEAYPASPPTLYVRPTADMIIRPAHTFVDASGCVSTPYLAAWSGRWVV